MLEFLSSLDAGTIIPVVAIVCGAIVVVARFVFVQTGEFGTAGPDHASSAELHHRVSEAVEASTEPLRKRIEELEAKVKRIDASVERDSRDLPTSDAPLSADDASSGGTDGRSP